MKWLDDLQVFLSGKKTILMAVLAGLDAMGQSIGWWDEAKGRQIIEIVMVVIFNRLGTTKSGPVDQQSDPAPTTITTGKVLPMALLCLMAVGMTACATDLDLGNGRVMTLKKVEARSAFGVNDSRSRLADCEKATDPNDITSSLYTDCKWMESEWRQSSSPGQGGQVISGALQGVGLGVAGALIGVGGNATANAAASATQSQSVVPRGH